MEQYLISRDGVELSRHDSYLEAVGQLHRIQGQSVEWACTHEGYAITEAPAPDHIVSRLMAMAATIEGLAHYTDDHATLIEAIILVRTHALDPSDPLAID